MRVIGGVSGTGEPLAALLMHGYNVLVLTLFRLLFGSLRKAVVNADLVRIVVRCRSKHPSRS